MTRNVPSYHLYGEKTADPADFWIHTETISERTKLHNWEIAAHRHEAFFQVFLVENGHGEMLLGGADRRFAAPAALFVPPGAAHGFRFSRDVEGLVMTARSDRLAALAAADRAVAALAGAPSVLPLPDGSSGEVGTALARIHAELHGRAPGRILVLEPLVTLALVGLARLGVATSGPSGERRRDEARIDQLHALIAAHFREHRPAGFYAERIGVSRTHLNRLARAGTGRSVQQLLADRIMATARRDLVFTPTPVQSIALALGFSDAAYFNRFFRKAEGRTPGAFRMAERRRIAQ